MTRYESYASLVGNTLAEQDEVVFFYKGVTYKYRVNHNHLSHNGSNEKIFRVLGLQKYTLATQIYGYTSVDGDWPQSNMYDFEALTKLVLKLFEHTEQKLTWKEKFMGENFRSGE